MIQRNIRRWMAMRNWQWWKLYTRVKPLLTQAKAEDEMRKMAEDYESTKKELDKLQGKMKELEEQNVVLLQQKNDMFAQMQAGDSTVADLEEKIELLINQKGDQDEEIKDLESRLQDLEGGSEEMLKKLDSKQEENEELKKNVENLELNLQKVSDYTVCCYYYHLSGISSWSPPTLRANLSVSTLFLHLSFRHPPSIRHCPHP